MTRLSTTEARDHLAEILNKVAYKEERIILHRRGKNIVAVVPISDLELLEKLEDRLDIEDVHKALDEVEKEGLKIGCPPMILHHYFYVLK